MPGEAVQSPSLEITSLTEHDPVGNHCTDDAVPALSRWWDQRDAPDLTPTGPSQIKLLGDLCFRNPGKEQLWQFTEIQSVRSLS